MTNFKQLYAPIAIEAAKRHGLPPAVFVAQLNQESGFNPNAVSPKGAVGIGQLLPDVAKHYGINPRDPHQSIEAAAQHMATLVKTYGDMPHALAAYNGGGGAVDYFKRHGGIFYNPKAKAGSWANETGGYVHKILSAAGLGGLESLGKGLAGLLPMMTGPAASQKQPSATGGLPQDDWVYGFVNNAKAANTAPKPTNFLGDVVNSGVNTVTGHLTNLPTGHGFGANVVGPLLGFGGLLGLASTGLGAAGLAPELIGPTALAGTGAFTSGTQDIRDQVDQYGRVVDPLRTLGHAGLGASIAAVPIAGETGLPGALSNAARFSAANAAVGSAGEVLDTGKVTAEQLGSSAALGAGMGALTGLLNKPAENKAPEVVPSEGPPGGPSIVPRPENTALPALRQEPLPEILPPDGGPPGGGDPALPPLREEPLPAIDPNAPTGMEPPPEVPAGAPLPQVQDLTLPEIQPGVDYTPLGDYLDYQNALKASDTFNAPQEQGLPPEAPKPTQPAPAPQPVQPQEPAQPIQRFGPQPGADGYYDPTSLNHPTDQAGQPLDQMFQNKTAANRAVRNLGLNRDTVIPYETGKNQWQLHHNGEQPPTGLPPEPPAAPTASGPSPVPEPPKPGEPTIIGGPNRPPVEPPTDLTKININKANNGFRILPYTDRAIQALPAEVRDPLSTAVQVNHAAHETESGGAVVRYQYRGNRTSDAFNAEVSPFNFIQNTKTGEIGIHGINNEGQFVNHYLDAHETKGQGIQQGSYPKLMKGQEAQYHGSSGKIGRAAPVHTDTATAAKANISRIKDLLPSDHPAAKELNRLDNILSKPIKDWGAARQSLERMAKNGSLEDLQKAMEDKTGPC